LANSGQQALEILDQETDIGVIISDQRMPNETGTQFFEWLRKEFPEPIRVLLTGFADIQAVIDSINKGAVYRYLTKPWDAQELKYIIENAFEIYDLRRKNIDLTEKLKLANSQLEFMLRQKLLS
jgi:DNA-binding NtrC family response regulator